MRLAK